jgi:signal transduction histidine kinase
MRTSFLAPGRPGTEPVAARGGRQLWVTAAAAGAAGGFSALVQWPIWDEDAALAGVNLTATMLFVWTGLMLRTEPGQRDVGWALVAGGLLRSMDFVDAWSASGWQIYDILFGAVDRVLGAYALLRYPNAALSRGQRRFLVLLTGWVLIGHVVVLLTARPQWDDLPPSAWWPALAPDMTFNNVANYVVNAGMGAFALVFLALMGMRLARAGDLHRIVITPIIVAGIASTIAAGTSAVAQMLTSLNGTPVGVYTIEGAVDLTLPLAFLVAVVQRTLLLGNIAALTAQVSSGADIGTVQYALRSALHDPTLEIRGLPANGAAAGPAGDRTGDGAPVLPEDQADRLVEFIRTEEGAPIAVVIADPVLGTYRQLFDAAVQTSALALKNAQLQEQAAREKLDQVRASRARIVEAEVAERRRIERNLHDGVQQRLLGLAARLSVAMAQTDDAAARDTLTRVQDDLRGVLAELRDLAHGIHPAVLAHGGLAAALGDVAERLPLHVRLNIPETRVPDAVEATAYFVACEALTNVVKHSKATSATVTVHITGSEFSMEIADDGVGGITTQGHGLSNIQDRANALDGEVAIVSPPGGGTRLEVRIPCG